MFAVAAHPQTAVLVVTRCARQYPLPSPIGSRSRVREHDKSRMQRIKESRPMQFTTNAALVVASSLVTLLFLRSCTQRRTASASRRWAAHPPGMAGASCPIASIQLEGVLNRTSAPNFDPSCAELLDPQAQATWAQDRDHGGTAASSSFLRRDPPCLAAWRSIQSAIGEVRLVCNDEDPAAVADGAVDGLRRRENHGFVPVD